MAAIPGAGRIRMALAGCVALLGLTAFLVDATIPAWAYPLFNTAAAAALIVLALIVLALIAGVTPSAIGLTLSRRTIVATAIGLASVTAVLGLARPPAMPISMIQTWGFQHEAGSGGAST